MSDNEIEQKLSFSQKVQLDLYNELSSKAQKKALEKIMYEAYYNDYKTRIEHGAQPNDFLEEKVFSLVRSKVKNSRDVAAQGYWWLTYTVNPALFSSSDDYLPLLQKKVSKALTKKCVLKALWTYELTKEQVPHCHMLLQLDPANPISVCKLKSGFQNTFKDVGFVHVKPCPDNYVADKIQYLKGNKWDDDKDEMVEADRQWRKKVQIEDLYSQGVWEEEGACILTPPPPQSI